MLARVKTAALMGIDALEMVLEADLRRSGIPAFTLVGLPDGRCANPKSGSSRP